MMKVVLACVAFGLSVAGAKACDFQRSAKIDSTVAASVTPGQATEMSAPATPVAPVEAENQTQPTTQ